MNFKPKPAFVAGLGLGAILLIILWFQLPTTSPPEKIPPKMARPTPPKAQTPQPDLVEEKVTSSLTFQHSPGSPKAKPILRSAKALSPAREPFQDEKALLWEEIQETLGQVIREKFPELRLSENDLRRLSENIRTFQESMQTLRELERTRANVERIIHLQNQIDLAHERIRATTGLTVAEFIRRARPQKGIDNE